MNSDGTLNETWPPTTAAGNCPSPYYNANTCSNGGNGTVRSLLLSARRQHRVHRRRVLLRERHRHSTHGGTASPASARPTAPRPLGRSVQRRSPTTRRATSRGRTCCGRWSLPRVEPDAAIIRRVRPRAELRAGLQPGQRQQRHVVMDDQHQRQRRVDALSPDGTRLFVGGHFGTAVLDQTFGSCPGQWVHGLMSLNPATAHRPLRLAPDDQALRRPERAGPRPEPAELRRRLGELRRRRTRCGSAATSPRSTGVAAVEHRPLHDRGLAAAARRRNLGVHADEGPDRDGGRHHRASFTGTTEVSFGDVDAVTYTVDNDSADHRDRSRRRDHRADHGGGARWFGQQRAQEVPRDVP